MTGISDLFRSFSEPDEYDVQYQLELFSWHAQQSRERVNNRSPVKLREYRRRYSAKRRADAARREAQRAANRAWAARRRADPLWREQERTKETARRKAARAALRMAT